MFEIYQCMACCFWMVSILIGFFTSTECACVVFLPPGSPGRFLFIDTPWIAHVDFFVVSMAMKGRGGKVG